MASKLEYLQRYMSGGSGGDADEKKKRKSKKSKKEERKREGAAALGTRIVDEDHEWEQDAPSRDDIDQTWELDGGEDDIPVVVAEGNDAVEAQDLPVYVNAEEFLGELQAKNEAAAKGKDEDLSPPRKSSTRRGNPDNDDDAASPPRRPRRRRGSGSDEDDLSPPRKRKEEIQRGGDSDASPPRASTRRRPARDDDSDSNSPPRRQRAREESPMKKEQAQRREWGRRSRSQEDSSPPRRIKREAKTDETARESSSRGRDRERRVDSMGRDIAKREMKTKDDDASPPRKRRSPSSPRSNTRGGNRERRVDSMGRDIVKHEVKRERDDASSPRRRRSPSRSKGRRSSSRDRRSSSRSRRSERRRSRDQSSPIGSRSRRRDSSESPPRCPRERRDDRSRGSRRRSRSRSLSERRDSHRRRRSPSARDDSRDRHASRRSRSGERTDRRSSRRDGSSSRRRRSPSHSAERGTRRGDRRSESPITRRKSSTSDTLITEEKPAAPPREESSPRSKAADHGKKNASPLVRAGLFTAKEFEENQKIAARSKDLLYGVDAKEMGANAETVYRDKRGRKLDMLNEMMRQQEIIDGKRKREEREEYEWGTGKVQKQERRTQQELMEKIHQQPFARHEDDEELERIRKERVRAFDPMNSKLFKEDAALYGDDDGNSGKKKSKKSKKSKRKTSSKPAYAGPPAPPNRFGIRPGYRWDGVVRGTGWEEKILLRENASAATNEEMYKYAVADM